MTRIIYRERIPSRDPRLKRHVHHDSESRRFAYPTAGLGIVSAKHERRIPVLDQGNLGSCTAEAGIGCLGTDPYFDAVVATGTPYPLNQPGALDLYRAVTRVDPYPGQWEPDDTGSDGLSIAKVLTGAKVISGYTHTFSLDDALRALSVTPYITGTVWTNDMFTPDPDGRVHPTGSIAGGHEYVADEIDAERKRVWCTNSWGVSWGVGGRFYLTFADYGKLLDQQGDVTIFAPATDPAPTPTPAPADPADVALAAADQGWSAGWRRKCGAARRAAKGLHEWRIAKNL